MRKLEKQIWISKKKFLNWFVTNHRILIQLILIISVVIEFCMGYERKPFEGMQRDLFG